MSREEQLTMFGSFGKSQRIPDELLTYYPELFNSVEGTELMRRLVSETTWEQRVVTMYGKKIMTPRLTAWYGDAQRSYTFSGTRFDPMPWTPTLSAIKRKIEPFAGAIFNSVLLNYYRDMNDSVAWHSDNEVELGRHPVIASVSFGQVRQFDIRQKSDHAQKYSVRLEHGSLLVMKGDLQEKWEHRIPKSLVPMKPRVNLTFRIIN